MSVSLAVISLAMIGLLIAIWTKRKRLRQEIERHSITVEELHALLQSQPDVLLVDVRRPLDLFASSEVIPGSKRVVPEELFQNPALIPHDRDCIIYCTCPGEESSRKVLRLALGMGFTRFKFLHGGFEAWKAKGYPLERYVDPIHLETTR